MPFYVRGVPSLRPVGRMTGPALAPLSGAAWACAAAGLIGGGTCGCFGARPLGPWRGPVADAKRVGSRVQLSRRNP
ncbi:hypothetical protein GCM10009603_05940 [Nocardiopsis exhalans]